MKQLVYRRLFKIGIKSQYLRSADAKRKQRQEIQGICDELSIIIIIKHEDSAS